MPYRDDYTCKHYLKDTHTHKTTKKTTTAKQNVYLHVVVVTVVVFGDVWYCVSWLISDCVWSLADPAACQYLLRKDQIRMQSVRKQGCKSDNMPGYSQSERSQNASMEIIIRVQRDHNLDTKVWSNMDNVRVLPEREKNHTHKNQKQPNLNRGNQSKLLNQKLGCNCRKVVLHNRANRVICIWTPPPPFFSKIQDFDKITSIPLHLDFFLQMFYLFALIFQSVKREKEPPPSGGSVRRRKKFDRLWKRWEVEKYTHCG